MENKKKLFIALFFSLLMVMLSFSVLGDVSTTSANGNNNTVNILKENSDTNTYTPWTFPTNTTEEPGYTGGTYVCPLDGAPGDLNVFTADTIIDGVVFGEVYMSLYQTFLNGSTGPSLATSYTLKDVSTSSNHTTYDVGTGEYENFSAIYTVHLRSGVRWTNWSPSNATQTYTFSNVTDYNNGTGVSQPHTFKKYKTMDMLKYELQSGDVVCSWRLGQTYGRYPGVVNVIPVNNLTVAFYVSSPNLLIVLDDFTQYVLPYNIWHYHNYANVEGYFNYSPSLSPSQSSAAYNSWDLGWNQITGSVPGLVGNGPFMVTNNFGMGQGEVIPNHVVIEYENPYFFYQYANASSGLRQWTPKIHAVEWEEFVSIASCEVALNDGKLDDSMGISKGDIPQFLSQPNSEVISSPPGVFNLLDFNVHSAVAPLNVTNFRRALNYAIPKGYIATEICDGNIPGQTFNTPANVLFFNSSVPQYSFSMSKARSLLNTTPGFSMVNGKLDYLGKPVTVTVDILSSAIAATIDLAMYVIQGDWESLGITVNLNLVSVGTMFGDLSDVQDGSSNNAFEIENFCIGVGVGDPALSCADFYNPAYGLPDCSYIGPFSNMTMNGKYYTGSQIDSLMDNLSVEAIDTTSIVTAEKLVKEMQGIEAQESIIIPLGYVPGHTPLILTYFKNQSKMGDDFGYFNLLSVEKRSTPLTVGKVAPLNVKTSVTQNAYSSNEYGNITITVLKNNVPVSGANITIGYTAPYSGILNVSSTQLVTNSQGVAVFEFHTTKTLKDLLALGNVSYEEINFTVVATQKNFKVSPAVIEATNSTHLTLLATAFYVTPTSPPPTPKAPSDLVYEIGLIVAAVVAAIGLGGWVYTSKFKVKKI